jgi:uncharacterized repeat protein (TIGR03803 family)
MSVTAMLRQLSPCLTRRTSNEVDVVNQLSRVLSSCYSPNMFHAGVGAKQPEIGEVMIRYSILALMSAFLFFAARSTQAQTQTVLHNFTGGTDGRYPDAGLTADGKGKFYGTTQGGGDSGNGTVFQLSPNGSGGWNETVIYSFCSAPNCADGVGPFFSYVTLDSLGNLYGTTCGGGSSSNGGTVWELSPVGPSWKETVLYSFNGFSRGNFCPINGLIMDSAGNLYGTTYSDGPASVFKLSPSSGGWTEQVIYSFSGDGGLRYNGLAMDSRGNIFGSTPSTVFELSPNGNGGWTPTVIHSWLGTTFVLPTGNPVLDSAGNLYGVTYQGGAYGTGSVYKLSPKRKGGWAFKSLYSFNGCPHHLGGPVAGVVLGVSGNLYGTTPLGGSYCGTTNQGYGTVFELVAPVGSGSYTEKVLWNFSGTDGANPYATLTRDSAGKLYGTTASGGSNGGGVVFEVTP